MKKNYMGVIALLFIGAVFGAVLVSSLNFVEPSFAQVEIGSKTPPDITENQSLTNFNNSFIETAEKLTPSIVQITVVSKLTGLFVTPLSRAIAYLPLGLVEAEDWSSLKLSFMALMGFTLISLLASRSLKTSDKL